MSIPYNKIHVRIELDAIVNNYRVLSQYGARLVAVVKSDAYGHGLLPVAKALAEAGARDFAVGAVEEGAALRRAGVAGRVLSLLGPVDPVDYPPLWEHDILPFIHSFEQLDALAGYGRGREPLPVALKFETGMGRLGFTLADVPRLAERVRASGVRPVMLSSHLATADEPQSADYVAAQAREFDAARQALAAQGFAVEGCLANSAAILANPELAHQAQRAGIALYGPNPFHGTALAHLGQGLRPAMSVTAPVVAVHPLAAGRSVSYGRTFRAERDMRVAIVGVGYADAYSRGLSGRGAVCLHGRRAPILGRVCMQMTAVDATDIPQARFGDRAYLLGGEGPGRVTPEDLAGWWGTITYEVFCLLGLNPRSYV